MGYQLFTDATADMCGGLLSGLPHIEIIPMEVLVGDTEYLYGPRGNLSVNEFYSMQREGKYASTTQISPNMYRTAFEPYLQKGLLNSPLNSRFNWLILLILNTKHVILAVSLPD